MGIAIVLVNEVNALESAKVAEALLHVESKLLAELVNENHCPFELLIVGIFLSHILKVCHNNSNVGSQPLALQFPCLARNLHIVQWIAQLQALEYRFCRYRPVFWTQGRHVQVGFLSVSQRDV